MDVDCDILHLYNQLNETGKMAAKSFIKGFISVYPKTGNGKIIQFPMQQTNKIGSEERQCSQMRQERETAPIKPVYAPEGMPIPEGIADLRPILRRDGLILLSWKQMKTDPKTYDIFWVTKTGKRRSYAALSVTEESLSGVLPNTGCGSESRMAFFNENRLQYDCYGWVCVAPVEIVKGPAMPDPRIEYIQKLEAMGIDTGSDIPFRMGDEQANRKAV